MSLLRFRNVKRALGLLVIVALAGCGSSAASPTSGTGGGTVTLTYWNFTATDMPFEKDFVSTFESAHPNIKINFQNVPVGELHDKLILAAKSQTLPDVFETIPEWTADMVGNNVARDITAAVSDVKAIYAPAAYSMGEWNGKTYALPWRFGSSATFYNVDLFAKAGIQPPTQWTWDEFTAIAKKLTDPAAGVYGFGVPGTTASGDLGSSWNWLSFLFQDGGQMILNGKASFNSPAGVEALNYYAGLLNTEKVMPPGTPSMTSKDVTDAFGSGKIAMFQNGPWYIATVKASYPNLKFGVLPLPTKVGTGSVAGGTELSIGATSAHPAEAAEFVKFLTSAESERTWATKGDFLPAVASVLQDPTFATPPMDVFAKGALASGTTITGLTVQNTTLMESLQQAIQKVLLGQADSKSALDQAATEWNQVLTQ